MKVSQFENEYIFDTANSLIDVNFNKNKIYEIILWGMAEIDNSCTLTEDQLDFLINQFDN